MKDQVNFSDFEEMVRNAVLTPDADGEFVKQLRHKLVGNPIHNTNPKTFWRLWFKPTWVLAMVLMALVLFVSSPKVVSALQGLLGYVPGIGLVDSSSELRVLAEPVSQTRDGVTLTIENVLVYKDRVEVIYKTEGVDPKDDRANVENVSANPIAFCGGTEIGEVDNHSGDAVLRLPDGRILERDRSGLYQQNSFSMKPVFNASLPENIMDMTLVLDCIPWTRLGAVPENWEVPFSLIKLPEGETVGLPVIDVQQNTEESTQNPPISKEKQDLGSTQTEVDPVQNTLQPELEPDVLPNPQIEMRLEKIVPTESNIIFYISAHMQDPDPSLVSIMPGRVYLVDSQGQEIQLFVSGPWQPFLHKTGTLFEYVSNGIPADGPLNIVVEDAVLYYTPLYVDPPQATPEELSFVFDVGDDPHYGQTWNLDEKFMIAGYPFRITSIKSVIWDDLSDRKDIDYSQGYEYGYQFEIQGDPRVNMNVKLNLRSDNCGMWVQTPLVPESSRSQYSILCREGYPTGELFTYVHEIAVMVEANWNITWIP